MSGDMKSKVLARLRAAGLLGCEWWELNELGSEADVSAAIATLCDEGLVREVCEDREENVVRLTPKAWGRVTAEQLGLGDAEALHIEQALSGHEWEGEER